MARLPSGMEQNRVQRCLRNTSPFIKHMDTGVAVKQHVRILFI